MNIWAAMWPSLEAASTALGLLQQIEYRNHEISLHLTRAGAKAEVRDGSGVVFTTHGFNERDALDRAKAWVDANAESLPAYDLHAG